MEPFRVPIILAGDYDSSPNPLREDSYIEGWNVLLRGTDKTPESWNGMGAAHVSGLGAGSAFLEIVQRPDAADGNTFVKMSGGSADGWRNRSLFYVDAGSGAVYWASAVSFDAASGQLKVKLSTSPTPLIVGMNTPTVPLVLDDTGTPLSQLALSGTRAAVYTEVNQETGWESNRSAVSNVFNFTNRRQARFKFPTAAQVTNGTKTTHFYLYITPAGLGGLGQVAPFFRWNGGLIPRTGAGAPDVNGFKVIDFNDTNLLAGYEAPVTYDPPPAGGALFVVCFDAYVVLLGTYGGSGISPSEPNNSGVFDPLNTLFPYTIEKINAVWSRAAAGYAIFSTQSSLSALYPVGGRPGVAVRPLWSNDGVPGGHKAGKFCKGTFFCYTEAGPSYIHPGQDAPGVAMNLPVRDEMQRNFDPLEVVVAWEPQDEMVLFAGRMRSGPLNGQWVAFPYRLGLGWGPKLVLPGQPQNAITTRLTTAIDASCFFLINGSLVPWNTAGGSGLIQGWLLRSGAMSFGKREQLKRIKRAATTANAAVACKLYADIDDVVTPVAQWTSGAGRHMGHSKRIRTPLAKSFHLEYSGAGAGAKVYQTVLAGAVDPRMV